LLLCTVFPLFGLEAQVWDHDPSQPLGLPQLVPEDSAVADFNDDGILDIAVANTFFREVSPDGSLSVYIGLGGGAFKTPSHYSSGGLRAEGVSAGRFNADDFDDLVVANFDAADFNVGILLADSLGNFSAVDTINVSHAPRHVRAADFDNDGFTDFATANNEDDTVAIYRCDGDGTFTFVETIAVGDGAETVTPANLNGDLFVDLIITNDTHDDTDDTEDITFLQNDTDGTFTNVGSLDLPGDRARFSAAYDFDNNGLDDFVTTIFDTDEFIIVRNDGGGSYTKFSPVSSGLDRPILPFIADLDDDGDPEVVVSYFGSDQLAIFEGLGGFVIDTSDPQLLDTDSGPYGAGAYDFTGDLTLDIFVVSTNEPSVVLFEGVPPGGSPPTAFIDGLTPSPALVGETVSFVGRGEPFAEIVAYRWMSDLVGSPLSTDASFSTDALAEGTHTITLRVENGTGLFGVAQRTLIVETPPPEPTAVINSISPSPANVGEAVLFEGSGTPAASITSFRWTSDLLAGTLSTQSTFSTNALPAGSHVITLRVENASGADETTQSLVVQEDVPSPTAFIDSVTPSLATVGDLVSFAGHGEPAQTITSFRWTSDLVGPVLSAQASFSTAALPAGGHTITFRVGNGSGFAATSTPLVVEEPDSPPLARILSITPNPADPGASISFSGDGQPPETIVSYLWNSDIAGTLSTSANFTLQSLAPGTHTISLRVDNPFGSDTVIESLVVRAPPEAIIESIIPNPARAGENITLTGRGDPAADIAAFEWTSDQIQGVLSTQATFSTNTLPVASHTVTLKVTDTAGFSGTTSLGLVVLEDAGPPQAIIENMTPNPVTEAESVTLTGRGEGGADIAEYRWRSSLIAGVLSTLDTFSTTALPAGEHTIFLRVTDSEGVSSQEAQEVLIVQGRPVASIDSILPDGGRRGTPVAFSGSGTPEGTIAAYRWRSSLDSVDLAAAAAFVKSDLQAGTHTIFFSVQNDLGVWSNEVSRSLEVLPEAGEETIIDDGALGTSSVGLWHASIGPGALGRGSLFSDHAGAVYAFRANLESPGRYQVYLRWTALENRRTDVPVSVAHTGGVSMVNVNQRENAGEWFLLGAWDFAVTADVRVTSRGLGQTTSVDGLRLVRFGS